MNNHICFLKNYKNEFIEAFNKINLFKLEKIIRKLCRVRKVGGRVFCIGVGGSAANASHLVNDFRKLCNIESYSPSDNISELTARINDESWNESYSNWLKVSKLKKKDALFILSVGGGNIKKKVSINIVESLKLAKRRGSSILGFVGKDGGFAKKSSDDVLVITIKNKKYITPMVESFQAVLWHILVSDQRLKINKTKW
jgi:D-sedoheptulose 7-phosphate isomerase